MPSSFTSRLKLERQASGENSGTWGNLVNYVFNRIDASTKGFQAVNVAGSANVTLTSNNSTSNTDDDATDDQVHNAVLEFTGALTGDINVFTDAVETTYTVFNNTSGSQSLTFAPTGGTGVALKQGAKTLVYTDGTTMTDVMADLGDITTTSITTTNVSSSTANADISLSPNGVAGRVTFNGGGKIQQTAEKVTTEATAATGTVNYDVLTQAVWNFTTDASANWTLNIRGDGSNSLDSIMDTGESITVAHIVKQGGTAYYNSAVQVDGSSITPEWQGGTAPAAGNINSLDVYTYTIIKTGSATFTALAAQVVFA